jgi:hypothetical protein
MEFLTSEGRVLMWNCRTKAVVPLERLQSTQIVELAIAIDSGFGFRASDGNLHFCDDEGRFGNGTMVASATRATNENSATFVRLQGAAGQKADGGWIGWDLKAPLLSKIQELGAVLDLDAASALSTSPDVGTLAWIELPLGAKPEVAGKTLPEP